MNHIEYTIEIKLSIQEINKKTWNELRKEINNPFYEWEWLYNLELSKVSQDKLDGNLYILLLMKMKKYAE